MDVGKTQSKFGTDGSIWGVAGSRVPQQYLVFGGKLVAHPAGPHKAQGLSRVPTLREGRC